MIGLDDLAFFWPITCDYLAGTLPPFSVDLLEVMGSCPLFYYSFVLLQRFFRYVGYSSASDEYFSWKYHHILVIFLALIIVTMPSP